MNKKILGFQTIIEKNLCENDILLFFTSLTILVMKMKTFPPNQGCQFFQVVPMCLGDMMLTPLIGRIKLAVGLNRIFVKDCRESFRLESRSILYGHLCYKYKDWRYLGGGRGRNLTVIDVVLFHISPATFIKNFD